MTQINTHLFNKDQGLDVSERYKVIKTGDVIDRLANAGWTLREQTEQKYRNAARIGYGEHVVKLIHPDLPFVDGQRPEVVLKNSYDGSSAYNLFFGIFRLICSNGLVVGSAFEGLRVRHVGHDVVQRVLESADQVKDRAGAMMEMAERMRSIETTEQMRAELYRDASRLVVPEAAIAPNAHQIGRPRRQEDLKSDLWTVYNRVQETAIGGGLKYVTFDAETGLMRRGTTRRIRNVSRNIEVNRRLWDLAASYLGGAQ